MKRFISMAVATLALTFGFGWSARAALATVECEAARCSVQEDIDACGCPEASNHGYYVSCVAHAVNAAAKKGDIPTNCRGKIKRCAARSTCGKADAVVCRIPVYGTCDLTTTPGACSEGTSTLADGTCAADSDCLVETRCKVKASDTRCVAAGGISDPSVTTCCPTCSAPAP